MGPGDLRLPDDLDDQGALDVAWFGDETDQEVGHVLVGSPFVHVRDREPEPFVLHVRPDTRVVFQGLGDCFFPGVSAQAVEHDMVEVRLDGRGVHDDLAGNEVHVVGGAGGVETADDRHQYRLPAPGIPDNRGEHLLGGPRSGLGEEKMPLRDARFCGDALVKPLPGDVDELREQPGPLRAAECSEELLSLDQGLGDRERYALRACAADVVEIYLGCGADHSLVLHPKGHRGVVEVHARVFVEVGVEGFVGQFYAVAVQLGEVDGQVPPFGQCPHFYRGAGVAGLGDLPVAGDERERYAVHLGVLGLEPASVWVDGVVAPPQAAADDLLAQ